MSRKKMRTKKMKKIKGILKIHQKTKENLKMKIKTMKVLLKTMMMIKIRKRKSFLMIL
jgi:hypothetical protein